MSKKAFLAVSALLLVALSLAACGGGSSSTSGGSGTGESGNSESAGTESGSSETAGSESAASGEPIVIGAAIAKTGVMSSYDVPAYSAFKLRVDELNEAGGIEGRPIKLVEADTASEPAKGKIAAEQVMEDGAEIVLATCDFDFGSPAALAAEAAGKVSFSLCAQSPKWGVQGIGPLSYTNTLATYSEGTVLAKFAKEKGFENPFLLIDDTISYDKELCSGFEQEWEGPIAGQATFSTGDSSIASQITEIKNANPGFIVSCTYVPGGAVALRQIRAAGINVPIVADLAMDGTYWTKSVPDMGEYYVDSPVSVVGDDPNPEVNELVKTYTKKYGEPPPVGLTFTGYGVMQAIEKAIEKTGGNTEGQALSEALDSFKNVPTIVGATTFTPELHINTKRKMAILEYVNNKPHYVESLESDPNVPLSGAK